MRSRHQRRFYVEHLVVTLVTAFLSVVLVLGATPNFIDRYFYDVMLRSLPGEQETDLVIVGIDEFSLRELGRWPWDRERLAALVDRLHEMDSGPVLLDLLLTELDLSRPAGDRALADALARHGHVYLPVHIEQQTSGGQLVELLPHHRFASQARGLGHVDLEVDPDGVVRTVYLRSGIGQPWWPHIALAMLEALDPSGAARFKASQGSRRGALANVREYPRLIPFAGDAGAYPQVSAVDVIKGRVPAQMLAGRTVLVGATAAGLGDMLATPLSVSGQLMPGVEVNASILDGLRQQRLIEAMTVSSNVLLTLVIGLIAPLMLPLVPPRFGMPLVAGVMAGTLVLGYLMLRHFQLWYPLGAPLVVALSAYPLWTWRRLEYTLDYLRTAMSRLSRYTALNRRLGESESVAPLLRMLERALPVVAWRLERRGSGEVQSGGEVVNERAWQTPRASHYTFQRGDDRYELGVLWQDEDIDPRLQSWVLAMANRVSIAQRTGGAAYEVVENYIERVAEEEVRQQALTQFFNASLEQLREGVLMCDACGSVLYANSLALRWLDLAPEQIDGLHVLDLPRGLQWSDKHGSWSDLVATALRQRLVSLECRRDADGREMLLELSVVDAGMRPGRVLIVTLKDVSDIKSALRTRTELLDFLSHDLRSPMISVLALAEKMRHTDKGQDIREFLDNIELHARKNLSISEQFLQLARVEALDQVEMVELDMLPVVESAIEQAQPQAAERDLTLRFHYDARADVWVRGNHELLERLVLNLLTNAIKYSHRGNSVDISLSALEGQVSCEVRDRGIGIAPEFVERLFERYTRSANKAASKERGAGLGLRFVKVVSERHGGTMLVDSCEGEGSRFTLLLPQLHLGTGESA